MIYFLLTIIAIGVLLSSTDGKKLLSFFGKLLFIASGLCLAYYVLIFLNSDIGKPVAFGIQFIWNILWYLLYAFLLYKGVKYLIKIIKHKDKRTEAWKAIKESYMGNKISFIFWGVVVVIIILLLIIGTISSISTKSNVNNAYFTCYGLPDQQYTLTSLEKESLLAGHGYLFDDSRLTQVCHEAYIGGSTKPQTSFGIQLEQQMNHFDSKKNYQISGINI